MGLSALLFARRVIPRPERGVRLLDAIRPMLLLCVPAQALAQGFLDRTEIIEVRTGSPLSDMVWEARRSGYELSDGTPLDLSPWYDSRWPDVGVTLFTGMGQRFGLYWGFSTGERGEKYVIEPGLKIGFLRLFEISRQEVISVSATAVLGGRLRERTCVADYGAIGGIQVVNCRLAASVLPPAETLDFLFDEPPPDQFAVSVRYTLTF